MIRTVDGDTIDGLLWQHLGRNDEQVTNVFWQLNPHASELGPIFLAGVQLQLPDLPAQPVKQRARAWD